MAQYKYRPWMRPLEFDRPTWEMLKPKSENIYTASRKDFRGRYNPVYDKKTDEGKLTVSVYTTLCYECANDVQEKDFPYSKEGLCQANEWISAKFQEFIEANPTRYK